MLWHRWFGYVEDSPEWRQPHHPVHLERCSQCFGLHSFCSGLCWAQKGMQCCGPTFYSNANNRCWAPHSLCQPRWFPLPDAPRVPASPSREAPLPYPSNNLSLKYQHIKPRPSRPQFWMTSSEDCDPYLKSLSSSVLPATRHLLIETAHCIGVGFESCLLCPFN